MTRKRALPVLSSILKVIELHSEMIEPVSFSKPVCNDPDDDKFLEAALAADADYVVTGDAALLNVKHHHGGLTSSEHGFSSCYADSLRQ